MQVNLAWLAAALYKAARSPRLGVANAAQATIGSSGTDLMGYIGHFYPPQSLPSEKSEVDWEI